MEMEVEEMQRYLSIRTKDARAVKEIKDYLENRGVLNKRFKIQKVDGYMVIYTLLEQMDEKLSQYETEYYEEQEKNPPTIESVVRRFLEKSQIGESQIQGCLARVPRKWSVYPPMVLFPDNTFNSNEWDAVAVEKQELYREIVRLFPGTTHMAINKPILHSDAMRRPFNITPIFGDFGPPPTDRLFEQPTDADLACAFWCSAVQNDIRQFWAPLYTMFSRGNIKEKKRVLDNFKCKGTEVLDLYCGIGYFSLSYLKNGCSNILCWELNPWSIAGFTKALESARISYKVWTKQDDFDYDTYTRVKSTVRVFIFNETNERVPHRLQTFPRQSLAVSHVNLGLLPSSRASWPLSLDVVRNHSRTPAQVHIHENVHTHDLQSAGEEIGRYFGTFLHLEKVKTFAPDVWHVVVDAETSPG